MPTEPLGVHDGQPILSQKIIIQKTGDGLSASVGVAPTHIETDATRDIAARLRHRSRRFVNVYAKDDEGVRKLAGVEQVDVFDATTVMFDDDRSGTGTRLEKMQARINEERLRAAGQIPIPGIAVEDDPVQTRVDEAEDPVG
jgi:hypothetical protein